MTAKQCTKKRYARAELLFGLFNQLLFWSSRSRQRRGILSPIYTAENFWYGSDEKSTRTKKIGSVRIDLAV